MVSAGRGGVLASHVASHPQKCRGSGHVQEETGPTPGAGTERDCGWSLVQQDSWEGDGDEGGSC